jgi:hypothetical protein
MSHDTGIPLAAPPAPLHATIISDPYIVAFVFVRHHKLIRTSMEGARVVFEFPPEAAEDVAEYRGGGMVEARLFARAVRHVKSVIFNHLGGGR